MTEIVVNVFSFCIYGTNKKYYFGLRENLSLINTYYPEHHIYIYYGKPHLPEFLDEFKNLYKNVYLFETNREGVINMLYRYKPLTIQNIETVITRDADSEINARDRYCIDHFTALDLNDRDDPLFCQVIRDHFWHKSRITGGLTYFKNLQQFPFIREHMKTTFEKIINTDENEVAYGGDEDFLNNQIYPMIKDNILVYTNICAFENDKHTRIDFINDGYNFCGNVIEYTENGEPDSFTKHAKFHYYDFDICKQLEWLSSQKQYDLLINVIDDYNTYKNYPNDIQSQLLFYKLKSYINNKCIENCMNIYKQFYKYLITTEIKNQTLCFFTLVKNLGYRIVGTSDIHYSPKEKEIVVYFGNYPDDYMSLPQSNKIYKHVMFLHEMPFDEFKYDECWNKVDQIFIMGLENEFERINTTILQLSLMNAPLHKLHIYRATKDKDLLDIYIGATKNHLDCLEMMLQNESYQHCLFLEDDFMFTSRIEDNKRQMSTFFERNYDYDICFVSASKYHQREDYDDLLILSKQRCTTSSGYFISRNNLQKVYTIVKEGYDLMKTEGHSEIYCIDRYWTKIQQDNKMFIFKDKLGFQKPSMSKITGKLNYELD